VSAEKEHLTSVSYIGDLAYTPPDGALVVENDVDYVRACRALSRTERSAAGMKLWVRSKSHFAWLRDFARQIGCPAIFNEKTARLVLADQWNVVVPAWLTDTDVLRQNLMGIELDARGTRTSFEDRLLTHLLGPAFESDTFSITRLVDVTMALVSDDAEAAFTQYPVLQRCLRSKCESWAEASSATWVSEICKHLQQNAGELWQWLSLWACLHSYPERLLEYVLTPKQVQFVRTIPAEEISDLPLEPTAREEILAQLELFFADVRQRVASAEDLSKVVARMSGRLIQEYRFVSNILKSGVFSPSEADVQMIQAKFRSCAGVSQSEMNLLDYCVVPSRPTLLGPEEERSWQEWMQWTTKEYAPYRSWQVRNGYYDEHLERTVARFSDWFVKNYVSIHKDPNLSLVHCLRTLSSSGSEDELSIVLLVDCLPVEYMPLLDSALRNIGLSRHDLHYRFAALPTTTRFNKPLLLSGDWQTSSRDYEAILRRRASVEWEDREVVYLSNLKALSEMSIPKGGAIAVLNFVDGDELLHSDVESKNTSYEAELNRLFARLAESLDEVVQAWGRSKEHFSVHVVTDHGACRILDEEKRALDSTIVNRLFEDEKHRFAAVESEQAAAVPDNLWALGHRFRQPFAADDTTYFLPSGHNTVRQSGRAKGYMHGGVTPEEVIVPCALYKLEKAAWKTPAARFLDLRLASETGLAEFYIQRIGPLKIEVQNPNAIDIRVLRASITSPETDLKGCETPIIPAASVSTLQMECYFKKAALGENHLEIEIVYEIASEQYVLPLTLECEFKSAMSTGFSLRDL